MSEKSQSMKVKLVRIQNLLNSESATEATIQCLKQLLTYFASADLSNEAVARVEVYEQLRDTVKSVFTYLDRLKNPYNEITRNIEALIRQLLLAICTFTSAYYQQYHPLGCGEMIRDFLSSDCRLFVLDIAAPSEEKAEAVVGPWQWAKQYSFKTTFFSSCIEIIMTNLAHFETKFEEMKVAVIGQYLRLLYYMDDYILKEKVEKLIASHIEALEQLFRNPSKEIMKDVNKQALDEVTDYSMRLLRNIKGDDLRKRVQLLPATLAMNMIRLPSIEKKIVACRIINKLSYEMLYKNNFHLTEQQFAEFLMGQGLFATVFEEQCQASIVKLCDDAFKLLVKRGCIGKERFQRFFEVLEKADSQLRRAMFRLIDPFRLDYYQIETINDIFASLRSVDFYDDEFFYFYEGISRYATQTQLNNMIATVQRILNMHYAAFPTYLTRRRAIQCYAYIFEKLVTYRDIPERITAYERVAVQFLDDACESKLIMLKTLFNNLSESKLSIYHQEQLAVAVVDQMQFLTRALPAVTPALKEDLLYFIRNLLQRYSKSQQRKGFSKGALVEAVVCPEIFEEMLKALREGEIDGLLEELATLTKVKQFAFSCIRWTFIHLNTHCLRAIKKEYADVIATYASVDSTASFKGIDILTYLIFNSERQGVRKGSCELLAEIATNFSTDFRQEGEIYLPEFLKHQYSIITHKVAEFLQGKAQLCSVQGALQLAESLLLNTEYFGVGSLRAHNSHIPTSSVWLRIYNNCGQTEDTQKIFEKKFPSNKTLFEVIQQVANQFKLGPLDIGLQFPNLQIIKFHGLTLEQLRLNGQELNAIKLPQSRSRSQPLLVDGELGEKTKRIFTEIFNKFAVNGYMGHKECANYVNGVTLTYCPINDSRITDLFLRYDLDRDEKLSLDDFLRFYKDCIEDPQKVENVEKNLYNLHYRSDLQPYDAPLDYNEAVLFRHHACNDDRLYDQLFFLANHPQLCQLAQTILLRLPTYAKVVSSLASTFDLKGKNSFEIQYLLTALQTHLNVHKDVGQTLIAKGNHISIFDYLCILSNKHPKGEDDKNCLIICLHVLRSLLGSFSLREINITKPILAFQLPHTDVFLNIIRHSVKTNDSALLEPALALQLTQNELPKWFLEESAFSRDKDTRVLTCNFLYLWYLSEKSSDLNLFKVAISPTNNEEWFALLAFITHFHLPLNYTDIFRDHLQSLANNSETLEGVRYNPLIFGSLKLIKEIYHKLPTTDRKSLNDCLTALLPKLISNQNRSLAYDLRREYPEVLVSDLERTVQIEMSKEGQARNRFVGIKNLGCICYMNSILQQFFMIKQFYDFVLSLHAPQEYSTIDGVQLIDDFLAQLQRMYVNLEWSQKQYYDPTTFCLAIKDPQGKPIKTHIQEDAHEFLNTAFDKIEGYAKKEERVKDLERLFGGKTVTEIICQTCNNKNEVLEHYYHLSVQVKGMKSLKESFDKLIQVEEISDYFCEDCNKKVEKITKQMLIKQSPEILIINLQRIIFDLQAFLKVKVHTKLQFEQTLDLHNYFSSSSQPALYRLKGVVIHAGTSEGGHYYSLIKHQDRWYKFNDQSVTVFSEADIGREAFGGDDVTDHWGEHTSSTNAYILFYERNKEAEEQAEHAQSQACSALIDKVKHENLKFAAQIQYNQPSFFLALHDVFLKYTQPFLAENKQIVGRIGKIYFQVLAHLAVNSDLKTQLITQIRDDILGVADLLEELPEQVLEEYDDQNYREIITNNSDVNIRDIYAKVLAKSLKTGPLSSKPTITAKATHILEQLLAWTKDEAFLKNLHKSYQYFELIKDLIINSPHIRGQVLNNGSLALFLDLLMGNDSILSPKDKKRAQFHSSEAIPLVEIINILIASKLTSNTPLSAEERKIFNQGNFYRKMMKNKMDIAMLAPIISSMARSNENFSKMMAEVLLKAMNSNDEVEDKNVVFANIRAFLLIEDELQTQRMKWVLGIPQLESISYQKPEFGLMTSSESLVYSYVSSLFYIKDEKYQPFLFTLFEKRNFFNSFSAYGTLALMELVNQSPRVLEYVLSLPSPVYVRNSYFGWIENFAMRVKNEEHYGLPMDKNILHERLTKLIAQLHSKMKEGKLYDQLPVNKYIIGKNAQLSLQESISAQNIKIDLQAHLTYVLPNLPQDKGNLSLPDDEYSFASTKEPVNSKFFLRCVEPGFEEEPSIEKKLTMLTFQFQLQAPFCIKFKIGSFNHRVHLRPGSHSINAPYQEGELEDLIEMEEEVKEEAEKEEEVPVEEMPPVMHSMMAQTAGAAPTSDYFMEIECKACTFLNVGRERCEMCDGDLLS